MSVWVPVLCWALVLIILEFAMWKLFSSRVIHISSPDDTDLPLFHFLTVSRFGVCIVLHGLFLIAVLSYFFWLLW